MSALKFTFAAFLLFGLVAARTAKKNPPKPKQLFAHSSTWDACFAFVQNGTNAGVFGFPSRAECERTVVMMDKGCVGPFDGFPPLAKNRRLITRFTECEDVLCPDTHFCKKGLTVACCSKEFAKMKKDAEADKCPSGSRALGVGRGKNFKAIFGETCDDLICGRKQKCVQINKFFSKCCGTK